MLSSLAPLILALAAGASPPDVFFISIDTMRADHLGFYGYDYKTSPNLDALAARSLVFDNAICEVPLTAPSFCSMLSSRFPRLTGVTRNGIRLPAHVPLVQEEFKAAGYETVCVQSNWTLKAQLAGLDRGFDVYEDGFKQRRWGIIKSERDADDVTAIALESIANRDPSKPMFGWFHYSDPHAPYKSHRGFDVADGFSHEDQRVEKVVVNYDSEIAFTDSEIGRLLAALPKENAVIVFVGDHGESIYEHEYLGHGRHVYQTCLHIPMFVYAPGIAPGRTAREVRGIDIAPTLLALAGIAAPETMLGRDVNGVWTEALRPRVIETYGGAVVNLPGVRGMMENDPPQRQAVLYDRWKLVLGEETDLLFDLAADPAEAGNLLEQRADVAANLRMMIDEWTAQFPQAADAESVELTEQDIEALTTLGYIE